MVSAPSPDQPAIRFVDVDGVRLRISVRGSGPPLLLITGLGASLELAEPFEREMTARGVQTISFDAPDSPEKKVIIDAPYVRQRLSDIVKDEDLSKFIL